MMDTDFLLIRKMKKGDDKASTEFIKKYYPEIMSYCYYHCYEMDYAEDLVQETFIRFFQKLSDYQHMGKAKNYLYTIAGNLCRDHYRSRREIPLADLPERDSGEDLNENNKLLIEWALGELPEELREIVILHYFQELTYKEIAGLLNLGEPLVKYRIKRAKELLKELCREEGESK